MNIQDTLACGICFEKYNNSTRQPHLLQCFHTFCQECLKQLLARPTPQSSISCPLCSKVTPCTSAASLPVNYALKDIVEASIAMAQDKMCDIHDATHAAIFWCFECEQGMCEEAHIMHSKAKASKSHQTNRIGAQEPLIVHKPIMCSAHNKELDLVCEHTSHPPRAVCISCFITSHQGHPCVTAAEYLLGKQTEVRTLLARAKASEVNLVQGAENLSKEVISVAQNRDTVNLSIKTYFDTITALIQQQQNALVVQMAQLHATKEKVLHKQREGLLATMEGLRNLTEQLEKALGDPKSTAKVIVLMEQLQQHLKCG
jgi:hypothetical protein